MTCRENSLKNVKTLKEAQVKVLQYFKLETEKKLIDPTPNKMWLSKKAKLMSLTLKKENLKNLPNTPKDFVFDLSDLSLIDGCSKSYEGMPSFFIEHIENSKKSEERFSSTWVVVRGEFYWHCIYLFKTVRHIILLETGMCYKFKKTEPVDLYGIV